jgi:hypothetical protein
VVAQSKESLEMYGYDYGYDYGYNYGYGDGDGDGDGANGAIYHESETLRLLNEILKFQAPGSRAH